ncbi:MAG: hypothetical protein CL798_00585 [Chromatiales bacterium]|nr:hypothetical protein [Chromatiales bacterium]
MVCKKFRMHPFYKSDFDTIGTVSTNVDFVVFGNSKLNIPLAASFNYVDVALGVRVVVPSDATSVVVHNETVVFVPFELHFYALSMTHRIRSCSIFKCVQMHIGFFDGVRVRLRLLLTTTKTDVGGRSVKMSTVNGVTIFALSKMSTDASALKMSFVHLLIVVYVVSRSKLRHCDFVWQFIVSG